MNDAGQTAFYSRLAIYSNFYDAILSEGGGTLHLTALQSSLDTPQLFNDNGQTAYVASFSDGGFSQTGIWLEEGGASTLLVRTGDQAPGTPAGVSFRTLESPDLNNRGEIAFSAQLVGDAVPLPADTGIWVGTGNVLRKVAWVGDPAPGTPDGTSFGAIDFPFLADDGTVSFGAHLKIGGGTPANPMGIWSERDGQLRLVVREGNPAPNLAGITFDRFMGGGINDVGQTYFVSGLSGPGVNGSNNDAIWIENNDSFRLVAREGDAAPGMMPGYRFPTFSYSRIEANSRGEVAFSSGSSSTRDGIWAEGPDGLRLVAKPGDVAPGMPPGARFGAFLPEIAFNDLGQVAFTAFLTGISGSRQGIWATDRFGQLHLVVHEGQEIEVLPGDFREVVQIQRIDNRSLNNLGQLAFAAQLSSSTFGVFVSNIVPEPASLILMILAMVGWCFCQRRIV